MERKSGYYHVKHYGEETVAKWDGNCWTFAGIETFFKDSEFDEIGPAVSRDSDAIEFGTWISKHAVLAGEGRWYYLSSYNISTEQLYAKFLELKNK